MPRTNLRLPPSKPVEQMGWEVYKTEKQEMLKDFKGKVLVLDFWATYCPPCIKEIPHLKELQAKYGEKGFQVIGLHVGGDEDKPRIPGYVERLKIDYPIAFPEDELIYSLLGDNSVIPQTLIFDTTGKLVKQFEGYDDRIKKDLDDAIAMQFTD
jgi:thiol-disulfide isomerase/thioredoxin